ncbi:MAG: hypothetical protein A2Z16_09185 [Chloroflexi bacterium RBG_16_54_18]|nr:MAG: hypothetical protein A2Z16_09185 [Chloroflexi bacterium RBG_16_54_18]
MAHSTGQILNNRYRIVSLIAQGGFGAIYRAWDMNLNSPVALKENLSSTTASLRQFTFEAQLLAKLKHENLPYVIDHFILPDQGQYLVMEFVEGKDLQAILEERSSPFSEAEARDWLSQVSSAVSYLHAQSPPIIHRDIKPANIKITSNGKVMLVDFGIAKVYKPTQHTTVGAKAVTKGYSPPEQYGGGITDARSDIYSLGATLYTLVTGIVPIESVNRHMGVVFLHPREIVPDISTQTEIAILKAMELNPDERYQTADQFCMALSGQGATGRTIKTVSEAPRTIRAQSMSGREPALASVPVDRGPYLHAPGQVIRVPLRKKRGQKITISGALVLMSVCILAILGLGGGLYSLVYLQGYVTPTSTRDLLALTSTELARIIGSAPTTGVPGLTSATPGLQTSTVSRSPTQIPSETPIPAPSDSPTPPPSSTHTPEPRPTWIPCAGTYPSRLNVGDRAFVSTDPPLPNRVRTLPDPESPITGYLDVSEKIEILEGPVCSATWIWWRVRSLEKNLTGWTAEGDAENYWLVPLP